jgi:hypothetical protein
MTRLPIQHDRAQRSRPRHLTLLLVLVMGLGALVAVLALPAIERVIWPDGTYERAH